MDEQTEQAGAANQSGLDEGIVARRTGWTVRLSTGSAGSFHDLTPSPRPVKPSSGSHESSDDSDVYDHQVWVHRVEHTAVVLGSTQRLTNRTVHPEHNPETREPVVEDEPILRNRSGHAAELCRRRSGGGLVVIEPTDSVWIDVIIPSWSPLHHPDIARSFLWLGRRWVEVLRALLPASETNDGPLPDIHLNDQGAGSRASDRAFYCFDTVGHGEVLASGRKVVGISQRRTRHWSRLQSLVLFRWDGAAVNELLDPILSLPGLDRLGQPPYDATLVKAGLHHNVGTPAVDDVINEFVTGLPTIDVNAAT